MKKVITYGTYDLLHRGHVALLKRAKALGDYLIVGVTADSFDRKRGKLNVSQSLAERIEAVRSTGIADQIIVEEYEGQKISDIQKYGVDIFTVGSDWVGKFDYLSEYCQVVYLPRTEGVSSTELRANASKLNRIGVIGVDYVAQRFCEETGIVIGAQITAVWDADGAKADDFCRKHGLNHCSAYEQIFENADAVFINTPVNEHFRMIMDAMDHGCHVICNPPIFLTTEEAEVAYRVAEEKKLVLFEGIKTLYFPAFEHMLLLVKSGAIGTVRDIDVSCSQIPEDLDSIRQNVYQSAMYDWGPIALLPIVKIYEKRCIDSQLLRFEQDGFGYFTKSLLRYDTAAASFKVGKGMKVEGELTIVGTEGYIYVPAPWWKTEYFEIRYEDLRNTKKYFFNYEGSGFRYMIYEFLHLINQPGSKNYKHTQQEILRATMLMEQYHNGQCQIITTE